MKTKKFFVALFAIMAIFCLASFSVSAATPKDSSTITPYWVDVRTMEFGVTYQGCEAWETFGAAYGPEKYLLHTDSATSAKLTFEHTDPLSPPAYDPEWGTDPSYRGDLGFFVRINDGDNGYYRICRSHEEITINLPAGYSVIEVYADRYVTVDSTYTIRVDQLT